jgi:hypothetical protein
MDWLRLDTLTLSRLARAACASDKARLMTRDVRGAPFLISRAVMLQVFAGHGFAMA